MLVGSIKRHGNPGRYLRGGVPEKGEFKEENREESPLILMEYGSSSVFEKQLHGGQL